MEKGQGTAEDSPTGEGASELSLALDMNEPIFMKENVRLVPFKTQILECRVKLLIGESAQVMVTPLRTEESQPGMAHPLPPRLHVLHAYTRLKMSSSKVSVVVRNISESSIFLRKGCRWHRWFQPPQCHPWSCPLRWRLL